MQSRSRWSPVRVVSAVLAVYVLTPMMIGTESCPSPGYAAAGEGVGVDFEHLPLRIEARDALRVGPGTAMCVTLGDSTELRGVYLGRTQLDDEAYAARLEAWRREVPGAPGPRAPIDLVHGDGSRERAAFLGFAYRAVEVFRESPPRRVRVPFSHFRVLYVVDGFEWTTDTLAMLDAGGQLPSREALLIGQDPHRTWSSAGGLEFGAGTGIGFGDTAWVAIDEVRWIEVPTKQPAPSPGVGTPTNHSDSSIGVVVGIAVGAILVLAIIAASQPRVETTQCESSSTSLTGSRFAEPATLDFDTRAGTYVEPAIVDSAGGARGAMNPDFALREAR